MIIENKEGNRRENEHNAPSCKTSIEGLHIKINFCTANRLIYEGVDPEKIVIIDSEGNNLYETGRANYLAQNK